MDDEKERDAEVLHPNYPIELVKEELRKAGYHPETVGKICAAAAAKAIVRRRAIYALESNMVPWCDSPNWIEAREEVAELAKRYIDALNKAGLVIIDIKEEERLHTRNENLTQELVRLKTVTRQAMQQFEPRNHSCSDPDCSWNQLINLLKNTE